MNHAKEEQVLFDNINSVLKTIFAQKYKNSENFDKKIVSTEKCHCF
jgi:hypothetical protein